MARHPGALPLLALVALLTSPAAGQSQLVPPAAVAVPHADTVNGEVLAHLREENAYTDGMLAHTRALQERLFREMVGHLKETDLSVPELDHGYYYYDRTVKGGQYKIFCRRRATMTAPEEVLLDENALGKGHDYSRVGLRRVSPDGRLLAYSRDTTGSEWYTVYVKDLRTGRLLPDRIDSVGYGLEWAADNRTLFFLRDNAAHRPQWIYRRALGDTTPTLVVEEPDSLFFFGLAKTKDDAFLIAQSQSFTTGEARVLPAARPEDPWRVLLPRREGVEYSADHHGSDFLVLTNDGAVNFRVLTAPDSGSGASWAELVPGSDSALIAGMEVFERHLVLYERGDGRQQIRVLPFGGGEPYAVDFAEEVHAYDTARNPDYRGHTLRFTYSSPRTPPTVYDFNLDRRTRVVRKVMEVPGYDPSRYATARLWATASDGARIPISVFYRKPLTRDGKRPAFLYAYGSYGFSVDPDFSSRLLSLVDRGFVCAIAHVRGGQEMGRPWYDQGRMLRKKNTFTDFIDAAEYLVGERWTSSDRLTINGGSAGGLLMGAVTNMRPDLFRAVVADVPFVDLMHTMLDPSLEFTVQEWLQWGNPRVPEQYAYMRTYSPYDNVSPQPYPAMLVTTGLNDPRVNYWEPAKWVARLRQHSTSANPILLRVNMGAGHGGSSGRYDSIREDAVRYAFLIDAVGKTEAVP